MNFDSHKPSVGTASTAMSVYFTGIAVESFAKGLLTMASFAVGLLTKATSVYLQHS